MIHGLIFDFDGLMVDTESPAYDAWLGICQEYECMFPLDLWLKFVGSSWKAFDPCAYLAQQSGRSVDCAAIRAKYRQHVLDLVAGLPLLPGVNDYLVSARQRGLRLGVATSSLRTWAVGHLTRLGVTGLFDAIITADDVAQVKPDPEIYQTTVTALGLRPEQVLAFEDTPTGLLSAKQAGLWCVAVPNPLTRKLSFDHADLRLSSLADMPLDTLLSQFEKKRSFVSKRSFPYNS